MPHPEVVNKTPFAVETLLLADEEGVALFVPCVQAGYSIAIDGQLTLIDPQPPLAVGGRWRGDPATTSLVAEPQVAFMKPATDVVLLGHAHAPGGRATEGLVGIRLGPVQKTARVFGDRHYASTLGMSRATAPAPFERIPLCWERAFGGWDRRDADKGKHACEARNPVGVGFHARAPDAHGAPLPNFEDPHQLIQNWSDTPAPAGFGFVSPDWQPRLGLAGTYDLAWHQQRRPLLPSNFDRRYFNAAAPGLVTPEPLRGDESCVVIGASPEGRVEFRLPGLPPPLAMMALRGRGRQPLPTHLDTVVVDMDLRRLTLVWRAYIGLRNGAHDVLALEMHPDEASARQVSMPVASTVNAS